MDLNFETVGVNFNGKEKPELIATPKHICEDMANLFDYTDCNKKIWADIYCKTGNTLEAIINQGVNKNNVVAICDNKQSQMLICRKLYGKLLPEIEVEITTGSLEAFSITRRGQVYHIDNWTKILKYNYRNAYNIIKYVVMKEMEKTMSLEFTQEDNFQINNIIMNPPYNNDMYIDFVELAHKIASENVVAITPAKFQAKSGEKNEAFRREIVPYISDIVFYPDCTDVFAIGDPGGIAYYIFDKNIHEEKNVTNISKKHKYAGKQVYNDDETRKLNMCLSNFGYHLVNKIGTFKQFSVENTDKNKRFEVYCTNKTNTNGGGGALPDAYLWGKTGIFLCLGIMDIVDTTVTNKEESGVSTDSKLIFSADTLKECEYFKSWANTRFVRFMLSLSLCGLTGIASVDTWWRFVPDPGAFDHIFTDDELYKKYNLTKEEIEIIESIIKERK